VENRLTNLVGYAATLVGTCLMLPQVWQAWETRRMVDVSFAMVILYFANCLLWFIYGLRLKAKPVVIANGIGLIVSVVQIFFKTQFS